MRLSSVSALLSVLCALLLAHAVPGQVRQIPNTGCPNAAYPRAVGQPGIGQPFGVVAPPCRTLLARQVVVLGVRGGAVLNPPIACAPGCVLACRPLDVIAGGTWRTVVPPDPRLIGACICVQSACVEQVRNRLCVHLSGALQVCVTR